MENKMEQKSSPVVEIRNLAVSLRRGQQRISALRNIDLSISEGEIVALVGESGSGKSVLGMTILGLLPSSSDPIVEGSISVLGSDLITADQNKLRELRRFKLGAVFQDPMSSLNPSMKIKRQIAEVSNQTKTSFEALSEVGITDVESTLERYPFELSGGQRQRVMIAMALLKEPSIVIADEPTTALDVTIQAQILRLIKDLRSTSKSAFLFITHDLGVAAEIADRIVVLYNGKILEQGRASDILSNPGHPYTSHLTSSRITMSQDKSSLLSERNGDRNDFRLGIDGCPWTNSCEFASEVCGISFPCASQLSEGWISYCHNLKGFRSRQQVETVRIRDIRKKTDSGGKLILEAVGVEKRFHIKSPGGYTELQALRNVDLKLTKGEVVSVVGESGSGKSTLLRILAGLDEPTSGSALRKSDSAPKMVFQDAGSSLTPWMSVGDILKESLWASNLTKSVKSERVAEALNKVGLSSSVLNTKTSALSGGQRQRVAIARCVIDPPDILLCDEPTSALDASLVANTLDLLIGLKNELEMGMVFVTHDLAVARYISDRILVMYKGRVVESGPSDLVCVEPLHPYTRMLLASLPGEGTSADLQKIDLASIESKGCPFAQRCPYVKEICWQSYPTSSRFSDHRQVDCHLVKDGLL